MEAPRWSVSRPQEWPIGARRVFANCANIDVNSAISGVNNGTHERLMPNPDLDPIDCRIVAALQADGRLTNLELAERVGLSPSPCLRRVKRLERDGYIETYRGR